MKKAIKGILCAALCGAALLGAAACGGGNENGQVTLEFAGSLQELYGAGGYPQAVLVVKNTVLENAPAAVGEMLSYMEGSEEYLNGTEPQALVADLQKAYPDNFTPSFNANNLNAQVIKNCSVKFEAAQSAKESVKGYLADVGFPAPADAFFYDGEAQEGTVEGTYTVYAPDGAPALALANAIHGADGHFVYHIVDANSIASTVTNQDAAKNADFCVLPSNAAAKQLGTGEAYTMLGVVTHGNLYFLRANTSLPALTAENLPSLAGKKVGVIQLANVPGLTFKAVLTKAGVPFSVLNSEGKVEADKVNLVDIANAVAVGPAGGCDYYLCPEPAATLKVNTFKAQQK